MGRGHFATWSAGHFNFKPLHDESWACTGPSNKELQILLRTRLGYLCKYMCYRLTNYFIQERYLVKAGELPESLAFKVRGKV